MEQFDIVISQKQARIFARAIYKNVSAYIQTHQQEYEQFLLEQKGEDADDENQSSYHAIFFGGAECLESSKTGPLLA